LPTIGGAGYFVDAGGLLSYWADWNELRRRSANYVDKILRGADPAVLAVELPDTFELMINLKTAKEIGITIPNSLLGLATHVVR
jgi:putative tryptophan/tyrosine transport system substrate-binding protein